MMYTQKIDLSNLSYWPFYVKMNLLLVCDTTDARLMGCPTDGD